MWREFCKFHLGHFHEDIKEESMRKPRSSLSWSKMENIKFIQASSELLDIIRELIPDVNLPKSYNETRKLVAAKPLITELETMILLSSSLIAAQLLFTVPPHLLGYHPTRMHLPLEMEEPVYVNAKQ